MLVQYPAHVTKMMEIWSNWLLVLGELMKISSDQDPK
jgi:hypothetical protein